MRAILRAGPNKSFDASARCKFLILTPVFGARRVNSGVRRLDVLYEISKGADGDEKEGCTEARNSVGAVVSY